VQLSSFRGDETVVVVLEISLLQAAKSKRYVWRSGVCKLTES
jgi:hypothetical protein